MMNTFTLPSPAPYWQLTMLLSRGERGTLATVEAQTEQVLSLERQENGLTVRLNTLWCTETRNFGVDPAFTFELTTPKLSGKLDICWHGCAVRLYVDGQLEDEEWPLGDISGGAWQVQADECVSDLRLSALDRLAEDSEASYDLPFQNFVTPGHNTGVGDCMPFARDDRYCLYYLFDRRGHKSKKGLGAHQWAQVSSADLKHWTLHPMAVGITEQWEGSICTGSLIQHEGRTYAFYAVRMSDGTPAKLTWAVSDDGIRFTKSDRCFSLSAPYEPVSARDPMVFRDAEGLFHMLVTTSLDGQPFGGCLAHLTSTDLTDWTQQAPFIVPGYADQPECSDYFCWNGWYYLIFSNFGTARYRMSRSPMGPWLRPENDLFDAVELRVPKTAAFHDRRFSTGFLSRLGSGYAGNAVTHELIQRPDGTLGVKHLEEILPEAHDVPTKAAVTLQGHDGRAVHTLSLPEGGFRLHAKLHPHAVSALFGIALHMQASAAGEGALDHTHLIAMDAAARSVNILRPHKYFDYASGRDLLQGLCGMDEKLSIDLIVQGDVLDLMLSDGRVMTMRLSSPLASGASLAFYVQAGGLDITDISLTAY